MPNIKPVSDLKNYTAVISQLSYGNRIYLTRNGQGTCALIDMKELDDLDRQKALLQLMTRLNDSKRSVHEDGMVSLEDLEAELGIRQ